MSYLGKLQFSYYDFEKVGYMPAPKPSLNGGLYTGEPFRQGAEWANIPVTPDATVYINKNLRNGNNPPPTADIQFPSTRQGNSYVDWPNVSQYQGTEKNWGPYKNIFCTPCKKPKQNHCFCDEVCPQNETEHCNKNNCVKQPQNTTFSKYYYVR